MAKYSRLYQQTTVQIHLPVVKGACPCFVLFLLALSIYQFLCFSNKYIITIGVAVNQFSLCAGVTHQIERIPLQESFMMAVFLIHMISLQNIYIPGANLHLAGAFNQIFQISFSL